MKKIFLALSMCFGLSTIRAQQVSDITQFQYNHTFYNPAFSTTKNFEGGILHRNVFSKLSNSIHTTDIWASKSFASNNGQSFHGVLLRARHEKFNEGIQIQNYFNAGYAYDISLSDQLRMSFGGSFVLANYVFEPVAFIGPWVSPKQNVVLADMNLGAVMYSKRFYVSVSSLQALQSEGEAEDGFAPKLSRHFFFSGGYEVPLGEALTLNANTMIKWVDPAPVSVDINTILTYKNKFWLGAGYRYDTAVMMYAGFLIKDQVRIGYSMDHQRTDLAVSAGTTHEIIGSITIGRKE